MKKLVLLEKIFTVASLILFTGAPLVLILSGGLNQEDPGFNDTDYSVINLLLLVVYFIAFCLLFLRWKKVALAISKGWLIWLLISLSILSFSWSALPSTTLNRIVAMCGTMVFSIYFSSRYTIKEQIELLCWALGFNTITSLATALILPQYGISGGVHAGLWRGVFNHKNSLGKAMSFSAICFLIMALRKEKNRWPFWYLFALSVFLLLMSKATSSLAILIILMVSLFILQIFRWQYSQIIPAFVGIAFSIVVLYSVVSSNAELIANIVGKDLTFTGRTELWDLVLDKIKERPWFGYGFGAFWQGLNGPSAYIWNTISFAAPNSHNGYLDLLLELGIAGFVLYILQFITCFINAISYLRFNRTADGLWPVILLLYIVLSNLSESGLYIQNNLFFLLQSSTLLSLGISQDRYAKELSIPDLIPNQRPLEKDFDKWRGALQFQYHYLVWPQEVMSNFIERNYKRIVSDLDWQNGLLLKYKEDTAFIKGDISNKTIYIFVAGLLATRQQFLDNLCSDFEEINKTIGALKVDTSLAELLIDAEFTDENDLPFTTKEIIDPTNSIATTKIESSAFTVATESITAKDFFADQENVYHGVTDVELGEVRNIAWRLVKGEKIEGDIDLLSDHLRVPLVHAIQHLQRIQKSILLNQ
jgi:exopolysaccharide production protein ExoQ